MLSRLLLILIFIVSTPAWTMAWTKTYAVDPVPGATSYRLEKTIDLGNTWIQAGPDSPTPTFIYTGTESGLILFRISALSGTTITTRTFDGLWHNEAWVAVTTPPVTGLIASFGFNEAPGTGRTTLDSSGNNLHGTMGAGVTRTTAGKFGNAHVFSGAANAFTTLPDSPLLDLQRFTLSAWVNPVIAAPPAIPWTAVVTKERLGGHAYALYATGIPSNLPGIFVTPGIAGAPERGVSGLAAIPLHVWTYLAGTYDGVVLRLYVNGVEAGNIPIASIAPSNGAVRIGGGLIRAEYFRGQMDEVRIYNRALSPAEIQLDMTRPVQ